MVHAREAGRLAAQPGRHAAACRSWIAASIQRQKPSQSATLPAPGEIPGAGGGRDASAKRDIRSADAGGEVSIPLHGIREPSFHLGQGGTRDHVLPGNKEYREGDEIQRPPGGGGGGGSEGAPDGSGEDTFRFVLRPGIPRLFLDDLELPDMAKRRLVDGADPVWHRAGYSVNGSPANLSLPRTMRNSLSRRIALSRPKPEEVEALEAEIAALEGSRNTPSASSPCGRSWSGSCCAPAASPISTRSTSATAASSPRPARSPRR